MVEHILGLKENQNGCRESFTWGLAINLFCFRLAKYNQVASNCTLAIKDYDDHRSALWCGKQRANTVTGSNAVRTSANNI